MPTARVPVLSKASRKLVENAGRASGDYAEGAVAAASKWASNAGASGANYKAAISEPTIDKRFTSGIQRAGAGGYSEGIQNKGQVRYGPGVAASQSKYEAGMQPYVQVIQSTDIGPRLLRGQPGNQARSSKLNEAMHKARLARAGAGR